MVSGVCVFGRSSVIFKILLSILCIVLIWGAISWCIAIATPAIYFPGMSCSGVAFGFLVAADVIMRYPFFS